jgi:hypothetical protein
MPRYFFNVFYGPSNVDVIGEDLPDEQAAWHEGTRCRPGLRCPTIVVTRLSYAWSAAGTSSASIALILRLHDASRPPRLTSTFERSSACHASRIHASIKYLNVINQDCSGGPLLPRLASRERAWVRASLHEFLCSWIVLGHHALGVVHRGLGEALVRLVSPGEDSIPAMQASWFRRTSGAGMRGARSKNKSARSAALQCPAASHGQPGCHLPAS